MNRSGEGSLECSLVLQGRNHAGLQAAFGDLQVPVQAIDQIDQQPLVLQLALAHGTLEGHFPLLIDHGELAVAAGVGFAKLGLVRGQGMVEQFADSFHPAYSLFVEPIGTDHQAQRKVRHTAPVTLSMRGGDDSLTTGLDG